MDKTYTPISGRDNDFKLADYNRRNEKRLHEIDARSTLLQVSERRQICEQERWDPKRYIKEVISDSEVETVATLGPDEFWLERAKVLFKSFPDDVDPDELRPNVINEAYTDFFSQ